MGDFWQAMSPLHSILQNPGKTTVLPVLPGWAWKVLNLYGLLYCLRNVNL